jgi:hypothetical protein
MTDDWINLGELRGEPVPAIVLYPGDRVLVSLQVPTLTQQEAHDLQEKLGERFPGATFTLITGAAQLAVMRGEVGEPPEHHGARGEMPTGEDFLDTFDSPDLVSTEHGGGRGILKWQRDKARREHRAAERRIKVLEQELSEQGAHFDAARQEYIRENEQLQEKNQALSTENAQLWDRVDEASRQLHDMLGRRIIIDNPVPREDHRKVTRERALARMQRDLLILAIRKFIDSPAGVRSRQTLLDAVHAVEREIARSGG